MKDEEIGPRKHKRVSKSSWDCRVRKWAKNAQGKQMGQECPRKANGPRMLKKKEMGQRSPQAM